MIETARLRLRPLEAGDLGFLTGLMGDPRVMQHFGRVFTAEDSRAWLDRQRARYDTVGYGYWLATERDTGRPVGQAGVLSTPVADRPPEPALGYILARDVWGRGYATEAAEACCDWAFRTLRPARVITLIRPENVPSVRVAERLRLRRQTHVMFGGYEHILFSRARADHVPSASFALPASQRPAG
ncbi:MAG: GNAT family N-acetyltransferase [Gemmatimonadetes bacterium]|nr:GNAT family N-acetyltransferase [Gemmatimonadota bacterium]